jgi:opacity protein-like surface antigen
LVSTTAHAEGFYAGGGLGFGNVEFSDNSGFFFVEGDDTTVAVKGIGGYRANDFLALELNLTGIASDSEDGFDDVTFAAFSASVLLLAPASESLDLFFRGGFYTGESEVGYGDQNNESGYVIGGGGQVSFGPRQQFSVRVEYEYFDTDELDELWAISGGFFFNF